MDSQELQGLLRRVRAGEGEAVRAFLDEFGGDLRRELRMLLTDPSLRQVYSISDLLQSILVDFYLRLATGQLDFHEPAQVVACLRKIAVNKAARLSRDQKAQKRDVRRLSEQCEADLRSFEDTAPSPFRAAAARDLLNELLERLPADLRSVAIA